MGLGPHALRNNILGSLLNPEVSEKRVSSPLFFTRVGNWNATTGRVDHEVSRATPGAGGPSDDILATN